MAKKNLKSPKNFINRELSWLEFNDRVLQQGLCENLPLSERLKFLAITSSNFDEFFMIRVAGLMQQRSAGIRKKDISGLTPAQQLTKISEKAHEMVARQSRAINEVLTLCEDAGLRILRSDQWSSEHGNYLARYFSNDIFGVLTPLALTELKPIPQLPGRRLNVALTCVSRKNNHEEKAIIVIPVPDSFGRFVRIPGEDDVCLAPLEEVIADNVEKLVPNSHILSVDYFRLTKDADVEIQEDEASDLLNTIEQAMLERRRRKAVRLEISVNANPYLKSWLLNWLELRNEDVYEIDTLIDAKCLMPLAFSGPVSVDKIPDWPPQQPYDLIDSHDIFETLSDHDVLLFHPYESFEPVVDLINKAADDPSVVAIKQTLYRTSGDSPIIRALERAAESRKEVTVLVELKARFDEERNINWARRLEDAGCHVIYGIAGLKTHAKALLIIRREEGRIKRYVHLSTGNYNDSTAKLYSDIGMMTTNSRIASDVAAFFNLLTGYSETIAFSNLIIAPTDMRQKFIDMIEREIEVSTPDRPGLIMAKTNSLEHPDIIKALYRASQAGVKIQLNVRGICCLRPGVKGLSENITVTSIVDRFLEHARIFYFGNGGNEEVYLSSADWMRRNLDKRLELLFPVRTDSLRRRLVNILKIFFADNTQTHILKSNGKYKPVEKKGKCVRAQENFYKTICEAVQHEKRGKLRFRPQTSPKKS